MIDGVISFAPSQETPPNGFANVVRADRRPGSSPASTSSNVKVPFVAGRGAVDRLSPDESSSSTVDAGEPELLRLDLARRAAAGLKSRQTTPVIPPCSGSGSTACFARPRASSGALIAGQAEQRDARRAGAAS